MLRSGSLASAGGPRQPAETGIARAETLGPDGGQRTWKPGPDAAVGPTGAQESTPSLFPSGTPYSGKSGGARRRASGHGRGGGQARRRDATRDAAACRSTGGGPGEHGGVRHKTIATCAS